MLSQELRSQVQYVDVLIIGSGPAGMAAAIAATASRAPVTILGAEAVNKSYPSFWDDYQRLGGEIHVL